MFKITVAGIELSRESIGYSLQPKSGVKQYYTTLEQLIHTGLKESKNKEVNKLKKVLLGRRKGIDQDLPEGITLGDPDELGNTREILEGRKRDELLSLTPKTREEYIFEAYLRTKEIQSVKALITELEEWNERRTS